MSRTPIRGRLQDAGGRMIAWPVLAGGSIFLALGIIALALGDPNTPLLSGPHRVWQVGTWLTTVGGIETLAGLLLLWLTRPGKDPR